MLVNIEQINFFFCKYNKENVCSETKQNTHFFFWQTNVSANDNIFENCVVFCFNSERIQ